MKIVKEEERFWSKEAYQETEDKYYTPLVASGTLLNYNSVCEYEECSGFFRAVRTFYDTRARESEVRPGPKQVPPHIKIDCTIEATMEDAREGLELIQNYEEYWPGTEMLIYGLAQAQDSDVSVYMQLTNYEHPEEDEEVEVYNE